MTSTLPGADLRGYFTAVGIRIPDHTGTEVSVRCFANPDAHRRGDRRPSCSINLEHGAWKCHGCGAKGGAFDAATQLGYTRRQTIDLMIRHGLTAPRDWPAAPPQPRPAPTAPTGAAARRDTPALIVSERDITHWQATLATRRQLIADLAHHRGWRHSTMQELELGLDRNRITIPVRDHHRRLVGLLRYQPRQRVDQPKMLAARGSRRALLPHPAAEPSQSVLLVEGEPDMIAARSHDLPAIAIPGVDAWRETWAPLFAGRHVTIIMDADTEGRRAAERIAHDLSDHAQTTIVDLAPQRRDGYDFTDWLLEGNRVELNTTESPMMRPASQHAHF